MTVMQRIASWKVPVGGDVFGLTWIGKYILLKGFGCTVMANVLSWRGIRIESA